MKFLWLVRHAKSSWDIPELSDIDRPLNARGYKDIHEMGERLKKKGVRPDLIISSPAVRAISTALVLARKLGYHSSHIRIEEHLYESSPGEYLSAASQSEDKHKNVFLVGHNPVISDTLLQLTGVQTNEMPTSGIACVELDSKHWSEVARYGGKLLLFDYPKNGDTLH